MAKKCGCEKTGEACNEIFTGLACTLTKGHIGDHMACGYGDDQHNISSWPQKKQGAFIPVKYFARIKDVLNEEIDRNGDDYPDINQECREILDIIN